MFYPVIKLKNDFALDHFEILVHVYYWNESI